MKLKRIEVLPQKRLSYQKHAQRAEHCFIAKGTARVTLDEYLGEDDIIRFEDDFGRIEKK